MIFLLNYRIYFLIDSDDDEFDVNGGNEVNDDVLVVDDDELDLSNFGPLHRNQVVDNEENDGNVRDGSDG